jgi:hypothetical protein
MTNDTACRVRNLAAWSAGALLCPLLIASVVSVARREPALGRIAGLYVAEPYLCGPGVLCGALGYAIVAAFRRTTAGGIASSASGATFAAALLATIFAPEYVFDWDPRGPYVLPALLALWLGLGASSYLLINR